MKNYIPLLIFLILILLGIAVIQYSDSLQVEEQTEPEYIPSFLEQKTCETKDQCKIGFICQDGKCIPRPPVSEESL